jgi:hypothetical protein
MLPSDHCINHENEGVARHPRFLRKLGRDSYEFVSLQKAPTHPETSGTAAGTAGSLTPAERHRLESQLREQLRQDCDVADRIGYHPTVFRQMMSKDGSVAACRKVIMSAKIPDGFMKLWVLKRLDLTAEATVLRGPWRSLFEEEVLAEAMKRLKAYDRPDLAIR